MGGFFGGGGGGGGRLFARGVGDGFVDSAGVETVISGISIPANTIGEFSLGQIFNTFYFNEGGAGAGSDFTVRLRIGPDLDNPLNNDIAEAFIFTNISAETYVLNTLSNLIVTPSDRLRTRTQLQLAPNAGTGGTYDITAPAFRNVVVLSMVTIDPPFVRANPNIATLSLEIDSLVGTLEVNPNSDAQYYGLVFNP